MPAKDIFHDKVRNALIKDGWTITDDPLNVKWDDDENLFIDIAAEKLLVAEKGKEKIAVEVKTFIGKSTMQDLHQAIGQYVIYRTALELTESEHILFLAVPMEILRTVFDRPKADFLVKDLKLRIIGFDVEKEEIIEWRK